MHGDLLFAVIVTAIFIPVPLAGAIAAAMSWRKRRSRLLSDPDQQLNQHCRLPISLFRLRTAEWGWLPRRAQGTGMRHPGPSARGR
jgi:hypothetical protein